MAGDALRGITWDHPRGVAPVVAAAAALQAAGGPVVAWEARSLLDFGDVPVEDLARTFDLMVIDYPHVGTAAAAGALVALDEHLDQAYLDDQHANSVGPSAASYVSGGHQWALAIDAAGQVSAGRSDLLDALGATWPETWDDVEALCTLTPGVGLPLTAADALCSFISITANLGGEPGRDPGRLVERELGIEALVLLGRLREVVHPASLDSNPIAMLDRMAAGDEIAYVPLTFGYTNYSRPRAVGAQVLFGDVPSSGDGPVGAILGGTGIAVSARCERVDDAVEFARFVASGEVQRGLYVEAEGQPGHRSAWLDPAANVLCADFFTRTLRTLDASYRRPNGPGWIDFQVPGGAIVREGLRDRRSAAAILDDLERLYGEAMRAARA